MKAAAENRRQGRREPGKLAVRAAAVALMVLGAMALTLQPAEAVSGLAPITAYAGYPPALPAGCPEGAAALVDVAFQSDGGPAVSDLRQLPAVAGATVTMSWRDWAAGCTGPDGTPLLAVTLAAYRSPGPTFDPSVDQPLLAGWASCGAGAAPCQRSGGRFVLAAAMPTIDVACNAQFEAVLGAPLAVVGPNGSYYSAVLRGGAGPTMLVSAVNYEITPCEAVAPTSASTTAPTVVSTTAPPATVAPETTISTVAAAVATTEAPAAVEAEAVAVSPAATLPFTGARSAHTVALGATLLAAGVALLAASSMGRSRRPARATA